MSPGNGKTPPKKWKNIIFTDGRIGIHPQALQQAEEMSTKEAIAALTAALDEALHEANVLPSKRTRRK
jgi:hypothetical protein